MDKIHHITKLKLEPVNTQKASPILGGHLFFNLNIIRKFCCCFFLEHKILPNFQRPVVLYRFEVERVFEVGREMRREMDVILAVFQKNVGVNLSAEEM